MLELLWAAASMEKTLILFSWRQEIPSNPSLVFHVVNSLLFRLFAVCPHNITHVKVGKTKVSGTTEIFPFYGLFILDCVWALAAKQTHFQGIVMKVSLPELS